MPTTTEIDVICGPSALQAFGLADFLRLDREAEEVSPEQAASEAAERIIAGAKKARETAS